MTGMKCPLCGRFLSRVLADITDEMAIVRVTGWCRRHHKRVETSDWSYEDFFPLPEQGEPNE